MAAELTPPPGWTVTHEARQVATEDKASAFTDGMQWTVRDPDGARPPQAEWPTPWYRQAVLYAWAVATRQAAVDETPPPYAAGPWAMDMLPRVARPVDPTYAPRPHQVERMAAQASTAGRVLAMRTFPVVGALLSELVALCSPIKGVLGVSKTCPGGQLGPGWSRIVSHGFGIRSADGAITESVTLRLTRGPRVAQWMWIRPVPHPVVLFAALRNYAELKIPGTFVLSALRALPTPSWKLAVCTAWSTADHGGPDDIPRRWSATAIKAEVRS